MFKRMFNEVTVDLVIKPDGPILIKAGETGADPTRPDMEFVRTHRGGESVVYLPGSSLKGVLRAHCERIMRTVDPEIGGQQRLACDPLSKTTSCSARLLDLKQQRQQQQRDLLSPEIYSKSCFICQLFGNQAVASHFRISDAYPNGPVHTEQRDGVAIDRVFGSVAFGPFQYETITNGEFRTKLMIRNFTIAQLGLLGLALRDLRLGRIPLGFAKSRGLGQVKADLEGIVFRYPTCELRAQDLYLLGEVTPRAQANQLLGIGAFVDRAENYQFPNNDSLTLPNGLQLGQNEIEEVELTLPAAQMDAFWRVAVPQWRAVLGGVAA